MAILTAQQARDLANLFFDLAQKMGNYRFDNWDKLSEDDRASLESRMWTLINYSSDFTAEAVSLTVDELDPILKQIESATKKMTKAIKTLGTVRKVLTVAAAAIKLGAAIMAGNVGQIAAAAQEGIDAATG